MLIIAIPKTDSVAKRPTKVYNIRMVSKSENETEQFGRKLGKTLEGGEIVLLEGGLGAGKTRFAKGVAKGLGVAETVTSPTFAIHNIYESGRLRLNHFDFYRLSCADEARVLGLEEYFGAKDCVCLIEWGENVLDILPKHYIKVSLSWVKNGREIKIEKI